MLAPEGRQSSPTQRSCPQLLAQTAHHCRCAHTLHSQPARVKQVRVESEAVMRLGLILATTAGYDRAVVHDMHELSASVQRSVVVCVTWPCDGDTGAADVPL